MNSNTGKIMQERILRRQPREVQIQFTRPIDPANLSPRNRAQIEATGRTMISRNSPCPCGSRKRFKRCCMTRK